MKDGMSVWLGNTVSIMVALFVKLGISTQAVQQFFIPHWPSLSADPKKVQDIFPILRPLP